MYRPHMSMRHYLSNQLSVIFSGMETQQHVYFYFFVFKSFDHIIDYDPQSISSVDFLKKYSLKQGRCLSVVVSISTAVTVVTAITVSTTGKS